MDSRLIVFDGPDGSGKSTQVKKAAEYLRSKNIEPVLTRDPGGTAVGENIRKLILNPDTKSMSPRTELLLYMASRAQLVDEAIIPALKSGKVVLCERFLVSSAVYQGIALGLDMEMIKTIGRFTTIGLEPDVTIILDVEAEVGINRRGKDLDRIEQRGMEFHKKVRDGFLAMAKEKKDKFKVIDSSRPVDDVAADVRGILDSVIFQLSGTK